MCMPRRECPGGACWTLDKEISVVGGRLPYSLRITPKACQIFRLPCPWQRLNTGPWIQSDFKALLPTLLCSTLTTPAMVSVDCCVAGHNSYPSGSINFEVWCCLCCLLQGSVSRGWADDCWSLPPYRFSGMPWRALVPTQNSHIGEPLLRAPTWAMCW